MGNEPTASSEREYPCEVEYVLGGRSQCGVCRRKNKGPKLFKSKNSLKDFGAKLQRLYIISGSYGASSRGEKVASRSDNQELEKDILLASN